MEVLKHKNQLNYIYNIYNYMYYLFIYQILIQNLSGMWDFKDESDMDPVL